ncbi:hypothetical protein [Aquipseudomonas alcaligenes]|uniref:Uncharacterized protein n=1 Tax=Aquipseudomonas alcaligenes TaxID=43263 RepID=A0A1N6XDI0_AQUAC|nr:hypothetical protein [Pseudomonas alcaligenes]SIR00327.1 hypothetical protein SAMN05878282_11294 [Pseudomonas alcaligenes]
MRTYILAMFNKKTKQYTRYQCQASSFREAVAKAQADLNGLQDFPSMGKGVSHAPIHA